MIDDKTIMTICNAALHSSPRPRIAHECAITPKYHGAIWLLRGAEREGQWPGGGGDGSCRGGVCGNAGRAEQRMQP